ncbi:MAG TPA: EpsI family protein [Opitutaceae bacterium]|nr:EpsI family protein [Opitutaceae bacterium]
MTSSAPDPAVAPDPASAARRGWMALAGGAAGFAVFQCFGNANHGYIDTSSLFYWWVYQWINPGSETQHGWLIVAVSGWLLWRNLSKPETGDRRPETGTVWPAVAAMVGALALHAVGFAAQQARVSIVALLLFAWGVGRLAGGRRWGAAAVFPLGFLGFAIPLNVLDSLGFWLRMGVIEASAGLAQACGIGVLRSGTQLLAPDGRYSYDVAAACSGVRSLSALAALALLAGYLNFRSWARRALVLLACFPLVYLGNVARIAAIVFAAQLGGQKWGERAHEVMGFGVFAIVLGGVLAVVGALRRWWPEEERADRGSRMAERENPKSEIRNPPSRATALAYAAAFFVVVCAAGEMVFLRWLERAPPRGKVGVVLAADGVNPAELPAFIGTDWIGRRTAVTDVERAILPADTGFSRRLYVNLARPRSDVLLSIVLSGRDRTSIHRPEICLVGQGWTIVDAARQRFHFPGRNDADFDATMLRVRREVATPRGPVVVPQLVAYWFVNGDAVVATHGERFARDAWNRVAHARADRWAYVLLQTDATDGEAAALARMQAILDGTLPAFQRAFPAAK